MIEPQNYVLVVLVALVASLIAGAVVAQVGAIRLGLLFAFFLSAPIGGIIAEAVWRITRKRGRVVATITAACIALGAFGGPWVWRVACRGLVGRTSGEPAGLPGLSLECDGSSVCCVGHRRRRGATTLEEE